MGMKWLRDGILLFGITVSCLLLWTSDARAQENEFCVVDGAEYVFQEGGLLRASEADGTGTASLRFYAMPMSDLDREAAEAALVKGWSDREEGVSIDSYGIPAEGYPQFYWNVLNKHPEFFYVLSTVGYSIKGDYQVYYDNSYTEEDIVRFHACVEDIIDQVPAGLNDLQKLLWVHDYIITHCQYDYSLQKFNAYNALVEREAVCQGISLAYLYLMEQLGVEVEFVSSSRMNHAWNLVELEGEYYHVDCTWDEGEAGNSESYCSHRNFLKSESGLRSISSNRKGMDWMGAETGRVNDLATSTKYDSYFWDAVYSAIPMAEGYYGYVSGNRFYLQRMDGTEANAVNDPAGGINRKSAVITDGNTFCYNTDEALWRVWTDGTVKRIYQLTEEERDFGCLDGVISEKDAFFYLLKAEDGTEIRRIPFAFPKDEGGQEMYRLYNPNSGEHFYTANVEERAYLVVVGWQDEGIGWLAPASSNTPVYRLYNPNAGDHHYTINAAERDMLVRVGWRDEGIGWYSDDACGEPLYRLYNPNAISAGAHHYTTNAAERDHLAAIGWNDEGIGWYGIK